MSGDAGWNAVIHHPSDLELQNWNWEENDGEQEKELPSTVDMDAIKGGGSWDPTTEPNGICKIATHRFHNLYSYVPRTK